VRRITLCLFNVSIAKLHVGRFRFNKDPYPSINF
jgi:hypothetical protein